MTLVSQIIKDGMRETNLNPLGSTPSADETFEALPRLQNLVSSVLGNEAGEALEPFPLGGNHITSPPGYPWYQNNVPADCFIPVNQRLMLNLTAAATVNLHPQPYDGARFAIIDISGNLASHSLTVQGNGRYIDGAATVVFSTNNLNREWFYRGDLGMWVKVSDLVLTDQMPYPPEFDDMFITMLAMRLNPRYGQDMDPQSRAAMIRSKSQFQARYHQKIEAPSEDGLLRLTGTQNNRYRNGYGYGYDTTSIFNSGYPIG